MLHQEKSAKHDFKLSLGVKRLKLEMKDEDVVKELNKYRRYNLTVHQCQLRVLMVALQPIYMISQLVALLTNIMQITFTIKIGCIQIISGIKKMEKLLETRFYFFLSPFCVLRYSYTVEALYQCTIIVPPQPKLFLGCGNIR